MTETAKVIVELDTSKARQSLRGMERDAATTGGRVGERIRSALGRGVAAVGIGAAAGAGFAAVRRASHSGLGSVTGDWLESIGANIEEWVYGDAMAEARATHRAHQEFVQSFGPGVGNNGVPPGLQDLFKQRVDILTKEEEGKRTLRKTLPSGLENLIEKLWDRLITAVKDSISATLNRILKGG